MPNRPSKNRANDTYETSTSAMTYIVLAAIVLLSAIALATWSERSFKLKPASGSAAAMSLAAEQPSATRAAGR